ncbi:MAG TPA: signal peptide peptidase SppA [Fibrobacteraceae bacterium]|nr:signal peptide peptidase SppA [Fibrobacteraceae bacterium]
MSKIGKILWFLMAFWALVCLTVVAVAVTSSLGTAEFSEESPLGLVKIEGELYDAGPIVEQLRSLKDEKGVQGIVLRVESPGGAVAAAQEIFEVLAAFRNDSFPVVASFGNVAASGGYYAALPAERIFANPGTLTGSIGVITQFMHGEKLMEKIGVEALTVTSGSLKDAGNPFRAPSEGDVRYFQEVVDDTYAQFLGAVAQWRKIPEDTLKPIADGRVFTGRMALQAGLVDTLGSMRNAIVWLATRCGLEEPPEKLRESLPPQPFLQQMLQGVEGAIPAGLRTHARVLWMMR